MQPPNASMRGGAHGRPDGPKEYDVKIALISKGTEMTRGLKGFAERKLSSAFSRFKGRVEQVRVRLTDVNGPRGGEDIRCRIEASVSGGVLVVEDTRTDPFAAIAQAGKRFRARLHKHFERLHAKRR